MKVPVNWLKYYVKTNKSSSEIAKTFTSLGLMLEKPIINDVLDLEHRFDRADWLSILGCCRDFAAFEKLEFNKPQIKNYKVAEGGDVVIKVTEDGVVNRFTTRVFKNIKVGKSPEWLKNFLELYGIASINNVVDITNYVMIETGQPLHAQDLTKFKVRELEIRFAKKGEKITTLLGTEIDLDSDVSVLSRDGKPSVITGIVGGKETGVTESTTEILLDAGNYNQSLIRKTSRRLKIQNETVARTDKYLHPNLTVEGIARATDMMLELCGGEAYENGDYYPVKANPKFMTLNYARLEKVSGIDFPAQKVKDILESLEYKLIKSDPQKLELEIPYFRTDIEVEDDIVADVLRINGYDNIPEEVLNVAPPKDVTTEIYKFENRLKDILVKLGLHEHITDPLVQKQELSTEILLENSLSSEKNALRTNITQTLEQVVDVYLKNNYFQTNSIKLFEVGKSFIKPQKEIRQLEVIVLNHDGVKETSREVNTVLSNLLRELGIEKTHIESTGEIISAKKQLGVVRYNGFTLDTEKLLAQTPANVVSRAVDINDVYQTEDVTLVVNKTVKAGLLVDRIYKESPDILSAVVVSSFEKSKDSNAITLQLKFKPDLPKDKINQIKSSILK